MQTFADSQLPVVTHTARGCETISIRVTGRSDIMINKRPMPSEVLLTALTTNVLYLLI